MVSAGDILVLFVLAIIFALSVIAVVQGFRGMKKARGFDPANRKIKIAYQALSAIHLLAGLFIALCFIIAGVFRLTSL